MCNIVGHDAQYKVDGKARKMEKENTAMHLNGKLNGDCVCSHEKEEEKKRNRELGQFGMKYCENCIECE